MTVTASEAKLCLAEGFLYWEAFNSPDEAYRVVNGHRDGERSAELVEPRIWHVASQCLVLDLWRTYHHYTTTFISNQQVELKMENPYQGLRRLAEIDLARGTFFFRDAPAIVEPFAKLLERFSVR